MRHDPLSDAFSILKNMEFIGRTECTLPASKVIRQVLDVIKQHKYVAGYEHLEDGRGGRFRVKLTGRINDCGVIKPRFSVSKGEFIKWEKRYLPSSAAGILIVTTSKGIMDQKQAAKSGIGGRLLGYIY
jgi:small subunit ribosomal protein S8